MKINRVNCVFLLGATLLCAPCFAFAQPAQAETAAGQSVHGLPVAAPEDVGISSEKLALVKPAIQQMVDEQKIPGAVVCVARRGRVVLFEAVGRRDVDADKPMEKDTIMRFFSMTKPITSAGVMILVDEGKLALDDPVSKHVPQLEGVQVYVQEGDDGQVLAGATRPMTIEDLLRHTSGLTYGFFGDTPVDRQYMTAGIMAPTNTLQEMADRLGKLPLLYQPGTRFNYSVSTDLLGYIIQRASGQELDEFFRQRIFDPLAMHDTAFFVSEDKQARFADNYTPVADQGGLRVIDTATDGRFSQRPTLLSGGGGLVSTAGDYMRFCQMLLGRGELHGTRLLKAETVEQMTRNQLPGEAYPISIGGDRAGVGFGYGFSVVVEKTDYTRHMHVGEYGWGGAASTHFWISPTDDLAVVALTQLMPFSFQLENAVKPLVYDALEE